MLSLGVHSLLSAAILTLRSLAYVSIVVKTRFATSSFALVKKNKQKKRYAKYTVQCPSRPTCTPYKHKTCPQTGTLVYKINNIFQQM